MNNEETALLLSKIDNLLNESSEKKTMQIPEAGETLHPEKNPDEKSMLSPKNQTKSAADNPENKENKIPGRENREEYYQIYSAGVQADGLHGRGTDQGHMNTGKAVTSQTGARPHESRAIAFIDRSAGEQPAKGVSSPDRKTLTRVVGVASGGEKIGDNSGSSQGGSYPVPSGGSGESSSSGDNDQPPDEDEKKDDAPPITATYSCVDFWGHVINAEEGTWVFAYNSEGRLCGKALVNKDKIYGPLHVYMDDATTPEKDGVHPGEKILFQVGGKKAMPVVPGTDMCQGDGLNQLDLRVES